MFHIFWGRSFLSIDMTFNICIEKNRSVRSGDLVDPTIYLQVTWRFSTIHDISVVFIIFHSCRWSWSSISNFIHSTGNIQLAKTSFCYIHMEHGPYLSMLSNNPWKNWICIFLVWKWIIHRRNDKNIIHSGWMCQKLFTSQ